MIIAPYRMKHFVILFFALALSLNAADFDVRDAFQTPVKKFFGAPFETLDFKKDPEAARAYINKWVADQTRDRIRDLVPAGGIKELTRLVLANAIYLKAPWAWEFNDALT